MGLSKINLLIFLIFAPLSYGFSLDMPTDTAQTSNHILYLMHTAETKKALQAYETYRIENKCHDFELLESLGLILLDQGFRLKDPETRLMTLFGAGISMDEKALYILEETLKKENPELQVIALNFLARNQNDRADRAIQQAMSSPFLIVRLEAAFQLALKKSPEVVGLTEALMSKIPESLWPVFPQIFAESGTPQAKNVLKRLLTHRDESVRVATILSLAEYHHDDFLIPIRRMVSHHGPSQQEACATALGLLQDESAIPLIQSLTKSPYSNVRLAALNALYHLGQKSVVNEIILMAKKGDLFAITLLGKIEGASKCLEELIQHNNLQIRFNAAIALLELKNSCGLKLITDLLIRNAHDIALGKTHSQGNSLEAFKMTPSAEQNFEDNPVAKEVSLHQREILLSKLVELPENDFLHVFSLILDSQQNDLVPALVHILENHPSPLVIEFLKKYQQKMGAPLIRNYCNLTLYRLKEPGPYGDNLKTFVQAQTKEDNITFRPLVPIDVRKKNEAHLELNAKETSRLLLDAFESFVATQDDRGIDILISLIQSGNQKNKYALIGLLMRAIQ